MNTLVLVELIYIQTKLEIREQLHLSGHKLDAALSELRKIGLFEVIVVSTCNHLEIYAVAADSAAGIGLISDYLTHIPSYPIEELPDHFYVLQGYEVVHHLMRVTCRLESHVLGETQIIRQVADTLRHTQSRGTAGIILSRAFTAALHTGKSTRAETAISRYSLSISHAIVALIKSRFVDHVFLKVLVVGAGVMAGHVVHAVWAQGIRDISINNRTLEKTNQLSQYLNIKSYLWTALPSILRGFDVVITATAASTHIICAEQLNVSMMSKAYLQLMHIDIGVPRKVETQIGTLPGCLLYDIDDLSSVVDEYRNLRLSEVNRVEAIIAEELYALIIWLHAREVVPRITQLRRRAETLAQNEVEQTLQRLPGLKAHEQDILSHMAHRVVKKLLHAPTVGLKR